MKLILELLQHRKTMHDTIALTCKMQPQHTIHSFVIEHGVYFQGTPLPDYCEKMEAKECFYNCTILSSSTGLTYVEGFVVRKDINFPIHHAWCIDDDGTVIDPTLDDPENCEYFGIPLHPDFVLEQVEISGMAGILDNYKTKRIYDSSPSTFKHPEWIESRSNERSIPNAF